MAGKRGHKPKSSSAAADARPRGPGCEIFRVVDDMPADIPVAPDELAALEKFLGPLLDQFLHLGLANRSRKPATKS